MTRNRNGIPVTAKATPAADPLVGITGSQHQEPRPIYRELAQLLGDPTADDRPGNTTTSDH